MRSVGHGWSSGLCAEIGAILLCTEELCTSQVWSQYPDSHEEAWDAFAMDSLIDRDVRREEGGEPSGPTFPSREINKVDKESPPHSRQLSTNFVAAQPRAGEPRHSCSNGLLLGVSMFSCETRQRNADCPSDWMESYPYGLAWNPVKS